MLQLSIAARSVRRLAEVPIPEAGDADFLWLAEEALRRGRVLAESQNFTRDLVNEPANMLPPAKLAERARAMAAEAGLECELLDQDSMRQLGMGSLLGVAQGSIEPPFLIVVRYRPEGAPTSKDHLGLVGALAAQHPHQVAEQRLEGVGGVAGLGRGHAPIVRAGVARRGGGPVRSRGWRRSPA